MTPAAASPKKVIVNATPTTIKETVTTSTIKTPKSRIVTPSSIQQVETPTLPTSPPPPPVQVSMSSPATIQATPTQAGNSATNTITVGPDQQQVFYTVSGEDGKTQQYMMLCPKDMDQNTLITTLVRQISADPTNKGRKTVRVRITQHNQNLKSESDEGDGIKSEIDSNSEPQIKPRYAGRTQIQQKIKAEGVQYLDTFFYLIRAITSHYFYIRW